MAVRKKKVKFESPENIEEKVESQVFDHGTNAIYKSNSKKNNFTFFLEHPWRLFFSNVQCLTRL